MNRESPTPNPQIKGVTYRNWIHVTMGLVTAALLLEAVHWWSFRYENRIGPAQPIPFSHRVHAREKGISCFMCHTEAHEAATAGVPPLETCMLCHKHIAVTYPPVQQLRSHYFAGKPVVWNSVYRLPDFAYFDHSVHIQRAVDCGKCHGDVQNMDRIVQPQKTNMGFCIQCHRDVNVTHDCFTCHR